MATERVTGARLLRQLVVLERQVAALEASHFKYTSPGPFNGVAASQRIYDLHVRVSVLEGTPPPPMPDRWLQGRTRVSIMSALTARIVALVDGPPVEPSGQALVRMIDEGLRFVETSVDVVVVGVVSQALVRMVGEGIGLGETNAAVRSQALVRVVSEGINSGETRSPARACVRMVGEGVNLGETRPAVMPYPRTIFTADLQASPNTSNNWTARNIVQISAGAGPLGQVRATFEAAATADFRINNASIGISVMANVNDVPDNGATVNVPVPLLPLPLGTVESEVGVDPFWYVPAGGKVTTDWASLAGFTKDNLLVVVIDHAVDTGNPRAAITLPSFPAAGGVRQGFQANKTSYNSKAALTGGFDGVVYAVSSIEVR